MKKVCLISMPFDSRYLYPSIQLASLKTYINNKLPNLKIDLKHLYLNLFEELDQEENDFIFKENEPEIIYGCLYYPKRTELLLKFIKNQSEKEKAKKLIKKVKKITDNIIKSCDWNKYFLVGFSCSYAQTFSSLYASRLIKKLNPSIKIVFGGNNVVKKRGNYLLSEFDDIDYIISGEGEKALLRLINHLTSNKKIGRFIDSSTDLLNLSEFYPLNYDDYFKQHNQIISKKVGKPFTALIYASKGCYYNKCTFCSLNSQYAAYRIKSLTNLIQEIKDLKLKYPSIERFCFADTIIPEPYLLKFAEAVLKNKLKLNFILELRATYKLSTLEKLVKAGLTGAQVGIEALNQNILNRMKKGTSVLKNIEIIKNLETIGISSGSNIITNHLNIDKKDLTDTLEILKKMKYYSPLLISELAYQPETKDYDNLIKSNNYIHAKISTAVYPNIANYPGVGRVEPAKKDNSLEWEKIKKQALFNKLFYKSRFSKELPGIYFINGFKKINVFINSPSEIKKIKVDKKIKIELLKFCSSFKSIAEIKKRLPKFSEREIDCALKELSSQDLIINCDNNYLSTPINLNRLVYFKLVKLKHKFDLMKPCLKKFIKILKYLTLIRIIKLENIMKTNIATILLHSFWNKKESLQL